MSTTAEGCRKAQIGTPPAGQGYALYGGGSIDMVWQPSPDQTQEDVVNRNTFFNCQIHTHYPVAFYPIAIKPCNSNNGETKLGSQVVNDYQIPSNVDYLCATHLEMCFPGIIGDEDTSTTVSDTTDIQTNCPVVMGIADCKDSDDLTGCISPSEMQQLRKYCNLVNVTHAVTYANSGNTKDGAGVALAGTANIGLFVDASAGADIAVEGWGPDQEGAHSNVKGQYAHYVNMVGYAVVQNATFRADDIVMDNANFHSMFICSTLFGCGGLNYGGYSRNREELIERSRSPQILYVELPFFFGMAYCHALEMTTSPVTRFTVQLCTRTQSELLTVSSANTKIFKTERTKEATAYPTAGFSATDPADFSVYALTQLKSAWVKSGTNELSQSNPLTIDIWLIVHAVYVPENIREMLDNKYANTSSEDYIEQLPYVFTALASKSDISIDGAKSSIQLQMSTKFPVTEIFILPQLQFNEWANDFANYSRRLTPVRWTRGSGNNAQKTYTSEEATAHERPCINLGSNRPCPFVDMAIKVSSDSLVEPVPIEMCTDYALALHHSGNVPQELENTSKIIVANFKLFPEDPSTAGGVFNVGRSGPLTFDWNLHPSLSKSSMKGTKMNVNFVLKCLNLVDSTAESTNATYGAENVVTITD
jgi:hypothetical protein